MVNSSGFNVGELFLAEDKRRFQVLPEDEGLRLDQFLTGRLRWLSRSAVQRLIACRAVVSLSHRLSKVTLKSATSLMEGDQIEVTAPQGARDLEEARQNPPLEESDRLYEDDCLVVVNKPAGVPVHPVGRYLHRTVLTALHHWHHRAAGAEEDAPRLVHRLDLETSGVLLAAKGRRNLKHLMRQFRRKQVRKEYIALLYGELQADEGEVDLPLGADEESRVPYKRAVRKETGAPAVTGYQVMGRGEGITLVRLLPRSGRKHQLRVHMAALGHAIVGDKVYGPDENYYFKARTAPPDREDLKELLLPRQALHAFALEFEHPETQAPMRCEAPCPQIFQDLLARKADPE